MSERSDRQIDFQRKRRASDRAEDRVDRASDHGDTAAMRIAGAQLESLLRARAAYRRDGIPGTKQRLALGE